MPGGVFIDGEKFIKIVCNYLSMAVGIEVILSNIAGVLQSIAPIIALILVITGGIAYGLAQTQPGETRGKWQAVAISIFVGGLIVAAISLAAETIVDVAGGALKPV